MKTSFYRLYENMTPALQSSGDETKSMEAIRAGLNLRSSDGQNFWDDFINVCGNSDALAELLEVPKEKVTKWTSKIKETLDKVKNSDSEEGKDKSNVISTGNDEPLADPNGSKDQPDLRPTP